MDEFSGKDEAIVEQWLVRQGLEKLVVFKVMFSQFCGGRGARFWPHG